MIIEAIKAYWDYTDDDRPPGHIGMSAIGHCYRQLAYMKHGVVGGKPDWRSKIIFDDGKTHHTQIRTAITNGLILIDSCYELADEELEVSIGTLTGHVDGILKHKTACQLIGHTDMLLEVKSMNERGFQELVKTGKLGKEYAFQTSAYLRATDLMTALVVAKNKNTGEMFVTVFKEDVAGLDERLGRLTDIMSSHDPEDIPREYQPKDSGKLEWQCNYCPYTRICFRNEKLEQHDTHKFFLPDWAEKVREEKRRVRAAAKIDQK